MNRYTYVRYSMNFYEITEGSAVSIWVAASGSCTRAKLRGNVRLANYSPAALTYKTQTRSPLCFTSPINLRNTRYAHSSTAPFTKYAAPCTVSPDCGHRKNQTNDPHVLAPGRRGLIIPSTYRASSCVLSRFYGSIARREPRPFVNPRTD